jgi:hypothetical protein
MSRIPEFVGSKHRKKIVKFFTGEEMEDLDNCATCWETFTDTVQMHK